MYNSTAIQRAQLVLLAETMLDLNRSAVQHPQEVHVLLTAAFEASQRLSPRNMIDWALETYTLIGEEQPQELMDRC